MLRHSLILAVLVPCMVAVQAMAAGGGVEIIRAGKSSSSETHGSSRGASSAQEVREDDAGGDVVMYGASWCGYCRSARAYFQRHRIPFTEYDVEKSAKGREGYRALGGGGLPLIQVGNSTERGFSAEEFASLYYGTR